MISAKLCALTTDETILAPSMKNDVGVQDMLDSVKRIFKRKAVESAEVQVCIEDLIIMRLYFLNKGNTFQVKHNEKNKFYPSTVDGMHKAIGDFASFHNNTEYIDAYQRFLGL